MVEVILHDIGEGMTQADILSFFVKPGDEVKPDQPLVEVQTDKMVAEIPAPTAGTVKELKVQTGECVKVGSILLTIEATSKQPVKVEGSTAPSESKTQNKVLHIEKSEKRTMAAPFTRKIARELGVDLNEIKGSGPAGRITDSDVKAAYEKMKNPDIQMVTEVQTPIEEPQTLVSMEEEISKPTVIPYRGRRKQIGQKMAQSLYSIPQCTHYEEIDVTNLLSMRTEWKQVKKNVSATAYFIKAISIALKEYPIFNATLIEKEELIHLHNEHHIGIATDTEDGLIVPVIKNVEKKSLTQIHEELKDLTVKAQQNKLTIKEMTGSTFTISNVGPLGGSIGATPIINPPEVGLVAFHKTKKRPIVNDQDEIVVRSMMNISMSFDHRVADGATAVAFTNKLSSLIEKPNLLMLELV